MDTKVLVMSALIVLLARLSTTAAARAQLAATEPIALNPRTPGNA